MTEAGVKTIHVITELGPDGAATMLRNLLAAQRGSARVISLTESRGNQTRFGALGIPVVALGMRRGRPEPWALFRLVRILNKERPDLVQTWMYHADLLGGIAARVVGVPVIWGVRHGRLGRRDKFLTRITRRACALLSHWVPEAIVCNSEVARSAHAEAGYAATKLVVVPNGFDLSRYRPNAEARAAVRRELGIAADAPLIGLVARYHPHKDHQTFLAAAAEIRDRCGAARFLLCGNDVDWSNGELVSMIDRFELRSVVRLIGTRDDMERITASLDVACLSSITESFPNVIGEAMACGVPCVASDCGDVAEIVGDTGFVVPVRDPHAFAQAVLELVRVEREAWNARSAAARARITAMFAIEAVARRFSEIQNEVMRSCAG